jgi:hypothetical protein
MAIRKTPEALYLAEHPIHENGSILGRMTTDVRRDRIKIAIRLLSEHDAEVLGHGFSGTLAAA